MIGDERYSQNKIFTLPQQESLALTAVGIVGLGGLGGYLAEMCARMGFGKIVVCDGDRIDESNLNRQILACEGNIGELKATAAEKRIREINSKVQVKAYPVYLNEENGKEILKDCQIVLDGLDEADKKVMLAGLCKRLNIPLVHGAISGWFGQVSVIMPEDDTLEAVYKGAYGDGGMDLGNPAFTPAVIAGIQVSQAAKTVLSSEGVLRGQILFVDTLCNEFQVMKI